MGKLLKRVIAVFCLMFLCVKVFMYPINLYANETQELSMDIVRENLSKLSLYNSEFRVFLDFSHMVCYELVNCGGENKYVLCNLYDETEYIGYVIWDYEQSEICELSQAQATYFKFINKEQLSVPELTFIYDSGNYAVMFSNEIKYLDEFGNLLCNSNSGIGVMPLSTIVGVTPQDQVGNCIATALAQVLYYWSDNGYPALNLTGSFEVLVNEVNSAFNGSFTNNSVPKVANNFVKSKCYGYSADCTVNWNPLITVLLTEIDNGRPCMLGFAAAKDSYSEIEGHMTMCYGYTYMGSSRYLLTLADGWETNAVYKQWSYEINDCLISIQLSIN